MKFCRGKNTHLTVCRCTYSLFTQQFTLEKKLIKYDSLIEEIFEKKHLELAALQGKDSQPTRDSMCDKAWSIVAIKS